MPKLTKQQRLKQKQQRARARSRKRLLRRSESEYVRFDSSESSSDERDEFEQFVDLCEESSPLEELELVREKLEGLTPDSPWFDVIVPESLISLEQRLPTDVLAQFLEEFHERAPAAFFDPQSLTTIALLQCYTRKHHSLKSVSEPLVQDFAQHMVHFEDEHLAVLRLCSLLGFTDLARTIDDLLWDRCVTNNSQQASEWAVCHLAYDALSPLATDSQATVESVFERAQVLIKRFPKFNFLRREHLRQLAEHLAGTQSIVNDPDLTRDDKQTLTRFEKLLAQFRGWLVRHRDHPWCVASTIGDALEFELISTDFVPENVTRTWERHEWEHFIERRITLSPLYVPLNVIAMFQFLDFLADHGLMSAADRSESWRLCDTFWNEAKTSLGRLWNSFQSFEKYVTAP